MLDDETTQNVSDSPDEETNDEVNGEALAAEQPAEEAVPDEAAAEEAAPEEAPAEEEAPKKRRRAASRPAGAPALAAAFAAPTAPDEAEPEPPKKKAAAKKAKPAAALFQPPAEIEGPPRRTRKKAAVKDEAAESDIDAPSDDAIGEDGDAPAPKTSRSRTRSGAARKRAASKDGDDELELDLESPDAASGDVREEGDVRDEADDSFEGDDSNPDGDDDGEGSGQPKRRRRRGGRRRKKPGSGEGNGDDSDDDSSDGDEDSDNESDGDGDNQNSEGSTSTRRRRRRSRGGGGGGGGDDDPPNTVVHVREPRDINDQVTSVRGSTRLEAKKQRRREGREAGRRRVPILTEAEFLARRESVDRVMVVRQHKERTQIAVLEDGVLSEHYVNRSASTSMVGNVYLGRVQNVLPSMEAAFVDIGRGRNAVLYAGEVNWDAAGLEGQPKRIELALKSGDAVLVQVTKDPVGHKGARLTSQISLPGRYLVYVPGGSMTGISRRLPDSERSRLKKLLRSALPENSGVIVRTAAEGATEEEITRDVERLTEQWARLNEKTGTVNAPELLHGEPDLATRVVRDIFNEDFTKLIVSGDRATETIEEYISGVAPDLAGRVSRWTSPKDVFHEHRVDEQLAKALDRKVWLPSGGSLVIDHTEAMTVVDVNTGKFTGQGGNLEQTVTRNNLEAAEEVVRQLRLRDVGGIIVIDFIDMVLESNRDLVLRRLLECLGRDRTKHQVAEVTSLGLVQMTRKRIGQGLLETFSQPCECCNGRGVKVQMEPVDQGSGEGDAPRKQSRRARPAGPIPGAPKKDDDTGAESAESAESTSAEPDPVAAAEAEAVIVEIAVTEEAFEAVINDAVLVDTDADPELPVDAETDEARFIVTIADVDDHGVAELADAEAEAAQGSQVSDDSPVDASATDGDEPAQQ